MEKLKDDMTHYINNPNFIESDLKLSNMQWDMVKYGIFATAVGSVCSIFFKKKVRVIQYSGGLGLGYALQTNLS